MSLTHDPSADDYLHLASPTQVPPPEPAAQSDVAEGVWVELLREGLTFDLIGLAPGPECEFPVIEHKFDLEEPPNGFRLDALHLAPGQHIAGGRRSVPVVKGLVGLARDLTHHFADLEAVVWPASNSAIGRRFFESIATAWLEGGAFPALGLTAFRETMDGGLQSVGLDFWIGQELRFEPPLAADKVTTTRLGVRLINQLVLSGRIERSERMIAPDGRALTLEPSRNGKFIRVWQD